MGRCPGHTGLSGWLVDGKRLSGLEITFIKKDVEWGGRGEGEKVVGLSPPRLKLETIQSV